MRKRNVIIWSVAILGMGFIAFYLDTLHIFSGDSLIKIIQARALIINNYKSESFYYPAVAFDPEYRFFPLAHVINLKGNHVGVFPVLLAFLTAVPLQLFGPLALTGIAFTFVLLCLFILQKYWKISNFSFLFAMLCTPLIIHGYGFLDVAVTNFFSFLGISIFLSHSFVGNRSKKANPLIFFFAGSLLGLCLWLRLEVAVLFVCFAFAVVLSKGLPAFMKYRDFYYFLAGFALFSLLFFLFNYFSYEHFLGPRFLVNRYGIIKLSDKVSIIGSILFGDGLRLGFFGYVPIFFLIFPVLFVYAFRNMLTESAKTFLVTVALFIPLIAILSPNDSNIDWGTRYLSMAILPFVVLLDVIYKNLCNITTRGGKIFQILIYIMALYSLGVTFSAFSYLRNSSRQLRMIQNDFRSIPADILIFQNRVLAGHIGLLYFSRTAMIAKNLNELRALLKRLKIKGRGKKIVFFEFVIPEKYRHIPELDTMGKKRALYINLLKSNLKCSKQEKFRLTTALTCHVPW